MTEPDAEKLARMVDRLKGISQMGGYTSRQEALTAWILDFKRALLVQVRKDGERRKRALIKETKDSVRALIKKAKKL